MNPESKIQIRKQGKISGFVKLFKKIATRISSLFKPEEVEVTLS